MSGGPALWGTKAGLGWGNTPVGKAGAVLGSCSERRGLLGPPARLGSSLRRMPPRQRRVLPRQPASGYRRRPVPQLADRAERPRRRAPGRWVRGPGEGRGGSRGSGGCRGRADGPAAPSQWMRTTTAAGTRTATPRPGATSKALPGSPSGDPATSPSAQVRAAAAGSPLFLPSLAWPLRLGSGFVTRVGPSGAQTTPDYASTSLGNTAYPRLPSSPRLCVHICLPAMPCSAPRALPLVPEKACEKPPLPHNSLITIALSSCVAKG